MARRLAKQETKVARSKSGKSEPKPRKTKVLRARIEKAINTPVKGDLRARAGRSRRSKTPTRRCGGHGVWVAGYAARLKLEHG